jgi:diadenosine tetraphosphate (Ap4A) HIT family hydrolase
MKDDIKNCPFCNKKEEGREIIIENDMVYATYDMFPVSRGHTLIIPKRHCSNYFDLSVEEQSSCWNLMNEVKEFISEKLQPDGFNIGINIDGAAGQTIAHVHIHLIPRYMGDVRDPKGGVRGVVPRRKEYPFRT